MFSKAKLKRFNEEVGCAPPPTAYDPKVKTGAKAAVTLDKSNRWKTDKEVTPAPGAYTGHLFKSPNKQRTTSSSKLNSSTCSSSSTTSGGGMFLSPPKPDRLVRSRSLRAVQAHHADRDPKVTQLEQQIKDLMEERDKLKYLISNLEKQLEDLQNRITSGGTSETKANEIKTQHEEERLANERYKTELAAARFTLDDNEAQMESLNSTISILTQQNDHLRILLEDGVHIGEDEEVLRKQLDVTKSQLADSQQYISMLTDERSGLQLELRKLEDSAERSYGSNEVQGLKERLDHLTMLRDNLESTARAKDDLIAELQVQLDEVVVEGRGYHEQMELYRSRMEQLEEELQNSFIDRDDAEHRVRDLISKYENLREEKEISKEILAKKDIEIELLNASLSNLNMKASEYGTTIQHLREEKEDRLSKISILETTISDLSMKTKEKEMMESILDEELNHRTDEVKKLEENLKAAEKKLYAIDKEKNVITAKLEEEKKKTEELSQRINTLEMQLKEEEVVQQFLEKEISSREAEISESSIKMKGLQEDLEMARKIALDLQQDAEVKLNEVLNLKATITAKDSDCEAKEELLTTLKDELTQKLDETSVLQERVQTQLDSKAKIEQELSSNVEKISTLEKELATARALLASHEENLTSVESKMSQFEDNNRQLEEKVVELMAEISDREAEHIHKMKTIESDLQDIGVKYSESLLEQEATRRVLTQTLEEVDRERLLRMASDADVESLKEEVSRIKEEKETIETNMMDLVQKYTGLEDALACEEAENRDLEERLEREVLIAKEAATSAEKELSTLKTSIEGFCTQITQLKIDMRKKSHAVEEMQLCIDALRDEKTHLTMLRDNLEKTVESKEETVAQLHLQSSTLEREMEEERLTLRSRIGDLENHLKETQGERERESKKISEIEEKLLSLEEENMHLSKSYENLVEEMTVAETGANAKLEDLKNQYVGYEDQLNNLQTMLVEKTAEVEAIERKYTATNATLESQKEEMKVMETSVKRFKREIDAMNKSLASKDISLDSLNTSLAAKSEEVQSLYKTLEDKQTSLMTFETHIQQLEEKEEKLIRERDQLALSVSGLQDELNASKSHYSRLETTFKDEKEAEVSRLASLMELDLEELRTINGSLVEEVDVWKTKFQHLEKIIEPFREQLDSYEVEKASLLSRSCSDKEEVDKLSKQYATLLGHQNHKQKIQHVLKLKTENNQLREDVHKLRQEAERQRKTIRRLEDKMHKITGSTTRLNDTTRSLDKENSFYGGMGSQTLVSTPLKPSNKPHRI